MATTRLRRTFHYPSDSDDPPDLDEEHQETLLSDLETADKRTSTFYRQIFLALPVLTLLNSILNSSLGKTNNSPATAFFLTFLQIAAPVLAAWILYRHPITEPEKHGLVESLYAFSAKGAATQPGSNVKSKNSRRLIVVGSSLSGMLVLTAAGKWLSLSTSVLPEGTAAVGSLRGEWAEIGNLLLPAGMCAIVSFIFVNPHIMLRAHFLLDDPTMYLFQIQRLQLTDMTFGHV